MTEPNAAEKPRSKNMLFVLLGLLAVLVVVAIWTTQRDRIIVEDLNGDGKPDSWLSYDPTGRPTKFEKDRNFDTRVDWRDTFVWEEAKKKPRLGRTEIDSDHNGTWDTVITYTANETLDRLERDTNNDGKIDTVSVFDAPNKPPLRIEIDQDGDGKFETVKPRSEVTPAPATAAEPAKKKN